MCACYIKLRNLRKICFYFDSACVMYSLSHRVGCWYRVKAV